MGVVGILIAVSAVGRLSVLVLGLGVITGQLAGSVMLDLSVPGPDSEVTAISVTAIAVALIAVGAAASGPLRDHRRSPRRGQVDMSLASVDSTVLRADHDAAGTRVSEEVLTALEETSGRTKEDPGKGKRNMPCRPTRSRPGRTMPDPAPTPGTTEGCPGAPSRRCARRNRES